MQLEIIYDNVKEDLSPDAPDPSGNEVNIHVYVNSDHAGYRETRRYRTRFLIYMKKTLVQWLSKKQPMIENSVFGDEFVTMKI